MYLINGVSNNPLQDFTLTVPNNGVVTITLRYMPTQDMWFYNIVWNDIIINGQMLVMSPNLLRQERNFLPFGFGCYTQDGKDPFGVEVFNSGYAQLFLLDSTELDDIVLY
jgi:hypothetical protein